MKILHINKYHYRRGGSETVFFNTMDLLRSHGHEAIPFSIQHPKNLDSEYSTYFPEAPEIRDMGIVGKIKNIPQFFWSKRAAAQLERLITEQKPDVAHLHNIFNGLSLSILPVLARHGIPVVITLHDYRLICPSPSEFLKNPRRCNSCRKTGYINCLTHRCYEHSLANSLFTMLEMVQKDYAFDYDRYIDRYIFLNKHYLREHLKRHSYFREKSDILFNFYPGTIEGAPLRGEYFLFYGRLTTEKGLETLIKAARHLPETQFKIAGTGPLYDSIKAMNLPNVELTGFLSGQKLHDTIRNASFVIVPSECEENNPLTIIESVSMGKPVIASDKKAIMEIVDEGKTGFIFPEGNVERLVDTIKLAQTLSDLQYDMMSRNALQFAKDRFDSEKHYERLMEIYEKAIKAHK